jgi:excisionase family DNA binding protein
MGDETRPCILSGVERDEMTVRQAAEILGVSRFRVHALIGQGQISAEKRISDVGTPFLVLKRKDVEQLAEERRRKATGEEKSGRGGKPKMPKPAE